MLKSDQIFPGDLILEKMSELSHDCDEKNLYLVLWVDEKHRDFVCIMFLARNNVAKFHNSIMRKSSAGIEVISTFKHASVCT